MSVLSHMIGFQVIIPEKSLPESGSLTDFFDSKGQMYPGHKLAKNFDMAPYHAFFVPRENARPRHMFRNAQEFEDDLRSKIERDDAAISNEIQVQSVRFLGREPR